MSYEDTFIADKKKTYYNTTQQLQHNTLIKQILQIL